MRPHLLLPLLALLLVPASLADAGTHRHDAAGIEIDLPDRWEVETVDGMLSAGRPGRLMLRMRLIDATDLPAARRGLAGALEAHLQSHRFNSEPASIRLHGMAGLAFEGRGRTNNDEEVELGVVLVDTPSEKALMVLIVIHDGVSDALQEAAHRALQSLRPQLVTVSHQRASVQCQVPKNWRSRNTADRLELISPDEQARLWLVVADAETLEAARRSVRRHLPFFSDVELEGGERFDAGGMGAISTTGSATWQGDTVRLRLAVVNTPGPGVLIAVAFGTADRLERHGEVVHAILRSIRPLD